MPDNADTVAPSLCPLCQTYPVDRRSENGRCRRCDDHELGRHEAIDDECRRCDEISEEESERLSGD